MRLGKDLIGKPIFSITDGQNIGSVKDVYLDNQLAVITGIHTGHEGLVRRTYFMIPSDSVVVFGIDAVLVRNSDVIIDEESRTEAAEWIKLSKLRGRQVDTPGGTKVATIGDVILGESGGVTGFSLAKVFVEGPVAEKGQILRGAMLDPGHSDGIMTIDLTQAENATDTTLPLAPAPTTAKEEDVSDTAVAVSNKPENSSS